MQANQRRLSLWTPCALAALLLALALVGLNACEEEGGAEAELGADLVDGSEELGVDATDDTDGVPADLHVTPDASTPDVDVSGECPPTATDEPCRVFLLVNQERATAGVPPYTYNRELALAAQLHAIDMAENDYFSHTSLDGRKFSERILAAGYTGSPRGENIAWGQRTPEAVMSSWMNSSGHRANILATGSNEIGVGFYQNRWVQCFGRR